MQTVWDGHDGDRAATLNVKNALYHPHSIANFPRIRIYFAGDSRGTIRRIGQFRAKFSPFINGILSQLAIGKTAKRSINAPGRTYRELKTKFDWIGVDENDTSRQRQIPVFDNLDLPAVGRWESANQACFIQQRFESRKQACHRIGFDQGHQRLDREPWFEQEVHWQVQPRPRNLPDQLADSFR